MVHPLVMQFTDSLLPTLSSRANAPVPRRASRDGSIGMQNTLSPYIGHCWRTVLCMYLSTTSVSSPIATHISHVPDYGSLGWQVVSALQGPAADCPQPLASGSLAPPESKQRGQGQQRPVKWRMHLYLLNPKEMDWNLSLCDKQGIAVDRHFLYECNVLCHYQFMFI